MSQREPSSFPDFDDLPKVGSLPQGCAWGIFDNNNEKDCLGTLNFLTPQVVQLALKEARDGVSVSLNWPLDAIHSSEYGRKGLAKRVISWSETKHNFVGFDDEVSFNTQCSSQWDSLIHYAHQSTNLYYNGLEVSVKDLEHRDGCSHLPTLTQWHDRGSLVGRGVLIDYRRWMETNGTAFKTNETHKITIQDIENVAKW